MAAALLDSCYGGLYCLSRSKSHLRLACVASSGQTPQNDATTTTAPTMDTYADRPLRGVLSSSCRHTALHSRLHHSPSFALKNHNIQSRGHRESACQGAHHPLHEDESHTRPRNSSTDSLVRSMQTGQETTRIGEASSGIEGFVSNKERLPNLQSAKYYESPQKRSGK